MFRVLTPDLFVVEQPFGFMGLDMGARMTVVRRKNGDLWAYAPFHLEADEETALKAQGKVTDIVVPNTFHTTQVGQFARRFPDATVWALPEVEKKLSGVPHQTLEVLPDGWNEDFDSLLFDGAKGFREWIVCHRASQTLLLTDVGFHLPRQTKPVGRVVSRLNDIGRRFGPSRFERNLMRFGDQVRERAQIETIAGWSFERILPGHGFPIERDAKKQFRAAYRFLGV